MRIDVLMFEGCPNAQAAVDLVNELAKKLRVDVEVREIPVESNEEADRLRFLGSPTVRVEGHDVEPSADERTDYILACRIYRTSVGIAGIPDRVWIQDALTVGHNR